MPDVQRELEDTLMAIVVGLSQNNTSLDRHVSTEVMQPFEDQKIYRTILDENCTNMHQNYYFKIVKIIISQNFYAILLLGSVLCTTLHEYPHKFIQCLCRKMINMTMATF